MIVANFDVAASKLRHWFLSQGLLLISSEYMRLSCTKMPSLFGEVEHMS